MLWELCSVWHQAFGTKGSKNILTIRHFLGKNIKNQKDIGKRPRGTISKQIPVRQLSGARSAQIYFNSSEGQKVTGWRKKVFYWVTNLKVNFNLKKLKKPQISIFFWPDFCVQVFWVRRNASNVGNTLICKLSKKVGQGCKVGRLIAPLGLLLSHPLTILSTSDW